MAVRTEVLGKGGVVKAIIRLPSFTILMVLAFMFVVMMIISPPFRSISNFLSVVRLFVPIAVAGVGVMMVIITGGIDLSLGSIYGFAGVITALSITRLGIPSAMGVFAGLAVSLAVGLSNGLLIVVVHLPPFIATLATMSIVRGLCYITTRGYPVSGISKDFFFLGQGYILNVPTQIWVMIVIAILVAVFMSETVTGRRIYALGGNIEATRISGVNTRALLVLVYTLCGLLAGLAGIITASKLGIGQPTSGSGFEMDAIAATVIGGTSLSGGFGTVLGTVIGAAIIGVLRNALVLLSVNAYWQQLIIGFVILFAVATDMASKNRTKK
ncbi:MAG: ABC transporter permease [Treponema sp.]|jgi:ribose transport system permease protein|nr:ABC transporter permease [Treponema sp.]